MLVPFKRAGFDLLAGAKSACNPFTLFNLQLTIVPEARASGQGWSNL